MHLVKRGDLETTLAEQRSAIQRVEAKLTSSGGTFSRNRESLIQKKATIQAAITQHEAVLRQLASGMLPFALVPSESLKTYRDLVTHLVALNYSKLSKRFASWKPTDVWNVLQLIIVEQLGVKKELVTPNASFVYDLGVD